jgi:hypothetical protein
LLLARTPDFLDVVEVLLDRRAVGEGFDNLHGCGIRVGREEGIPVVTAPPIPAMAKQTTRKMARPSQGCLGVIGLCLTQKSAGYDAARPIEREAKVTESVRRADRLGPPRTRRAVSGNLLRNAIAFCAGAHQRTYDRVPYRVELPDFMWISGLLQASHLPIIIDTVDPKGQFLSREVQSWRFCYSWRPIGS